MQRPFFAHRANNQISKRGFRWVAFFGVTLLLSVAAHASYPRHQKVVVKPSWSGHSIAELEPNVSMLSQTQSMVQERLADDLLDSSAVPGMQQEYQDANRDYEMRQQYGLLDSLGEEQQIRKMVDLSKKLNAQLRQKQTKKVATSLRGKALQDENLRQPVIVAATIAAATTGTPLDARLGEDTTVRASANLPYQTGYMQVLSPLGTGQFTFVGKADAGNGGITLPPPDWISRTEHYTLSFSRPLPVWNLGSGVSYGATSNTVTASLNKQLHKNLSASVSSIRALDLDPSKSRMVEDTVRVNYEIHF